MCKKKSKKDEWSVNQATHSGWEFAGHWNGNRQLDSCYNKLACGQDSKIAEA